MDNASDDVLYRSSLLGGTFIQLGRPGWRQLACLQHQWQTLHAEAARARDASDRLAEWAAGEEGGELSFSGDELGDGGRLLDPEDVLRLTLAPVWLTVSADCSGEPGCCQLVNLDMVLSQLSSAQERTAAATAHLAAIAACEAHLSEALAWLVDQPTDLTDDAGRHQWFTSTCPACMCDPYPHAQMLQGRLSQLSLELSQAARRWQLTVQVERP